MDIMNSDSRHQVQGRTKSARIANALEEMILSKRLNAGELLPSQQELAGKFDASSRSIREAFKQLEAKGLVSVSQGRRACVKSNNLDQFVESLSSAIIRSGSSNTKLMLDMVQVRTSVEVSAARDFSRNPYRKEVSLDLQQISHDMLDLMPAIRQKDANSIKKFQMLESDFHKVLIMSNDNIILDAIYENLSPLLDQSLLFSASTSDEFEKKAREYLYICEALGAGQTDLAVALVLVNLTNLKKKIELHSAERGIHTAFA